MTRSSTGEVTEEERRSCKETRPTRPWTPLCSSSITLDAVSASQISHLLSVRSANVLLFLWLHSSLGFTNLQFTFPQSSSTCSVWQFRFDVTVSLSILTLVPPAASSTDTSVLML